jgi:hypothetical protein
VFGCAIRKEKKKTKENKNAKRKLSLRSLSLLYVCVVESRIERTKEKKLKEERRVL